MCCFLYSHAIKNINILIKKLQLSTKIRQKIPNFTLTKNTKNIKI